MSFKKQPQTIWGWITWCVAFFVMIVMMRVLLLVVVDPGYTAFMSADPLHPKPIQFVPLTQISRHLVRAVLVSEDDQFFEHSGFQWDSIKKAWETNQKKQKKVSGASTLSQQLARNLFLTRSKTWARKIKEAALTVLIELFLPKERILELYLNVAEMGPAIYGVGQASRYHFGVNPSELSQVQASLLAATLINGKIYGQKPYPARTVNRQKKILYRMSHYALAIPDFVNKAPVLPVKKEDEKTILSLIKDMTEQEAEEPDDPVEEEADLMLVLPAKSKEPVGDKTPEHPHSEDEDKSEAETDSENPDEKSPIFLDEDS